MAFRRKQKTLRLPPGTRQMSDADIEALIRLGLIEKTKDGYKVREDLDGRK